MKKQKEIIKKFFNRELSEEERNEFINKAGTDKKFIKSFVKELEIRSDAEDNLPEGGEATPDLGKAVD